MQIQAKGQKKFGNRTITKMTYTEESIMTEIEKRKKLASLPWQALFDLAIKKDIDESLIKGKEKSVIISKLLIGDLLSDNEVDNLVNDYIYGDRVSFTLWNFEKKLLKAQYDIIYSLEGNTETFLSVSGFRGLSILSVKDCMDRIEILYVYSKEYSFINEDGKNDSVWEQHRGCLWVGVSASYLACISKHDKMTNCIVKYIVSKIRIPLTQIKPPKSAIERCITQIARSKIVLQGTNGEKTVVSRSEGLTDAQLEEIQRIQEGRFDTSGSYIAEITEDAQATIKYNVKKGSIGILKHLSASVLFAWSQAAISIILEEIENLKGRPAKEIFNELGLEIKWAYLSNNEKVQAEWFLSQAIACLGSKEEGISVIPNYVKSILLNEKLFTIIPRIYCEQCSGYETPCCTECGKPLKATSKGQLYCSCGAPVQLQCSEGHRYCRAENWFIPTSKMYNILNQNIQCVFKQDSPGLIMCIMGDCLHIAHSNSVNTDGVELHFGDIDCFLNLPEPNDNAREFAVKLGEKCDGSCTNAKVCKCVSNSSMACLPKIFYTVIPGFRPQPHKGLEYGDVSGEIKTENHSYEMKGIIKKNSKNSTRSTRTVGELISTHLLSTSKEGEEIIRQFVEQGLVDGRVDVIAVIAPQYIDSSFKGTLRYLAKLVGKRVLFIELDDVARLIIKNDTISI